MPKTAPYGSWKSPITSDLIVAQSIALSEARLDRGKVYWLEGRPQEQGRIAIVRADWLDPAAVAILPVADFRSDLDTQDLAFGQPRDVEQENAGAAQETEC